MHRPACHFLKFSKSDFDSLADLVRVAGHQRMPLVLSLQLMVVMSRVSVCVLELYVLSSSDDSLKSLIRVSGLLSSAQL